IRPYAVGRQSRKGNRLDNSRESEERDEPPHRRTSGPQGRGLRGSKTEATGAGCSVALLEDDVEALQGSHVDRRLDERLLEDVDVLLSDLQHPADHDTGGEDTANARRDGQ